jgi:hypothetical protein
MLFALVVYPEWELLEASILQRTKNRVDILFEAST